MSVKRPAVLFLSSLILGIIIANSLIPTTFKLLLILIAIFLYGKLFFEGKLSTKILLVIFLFLLIGFYRFKIEEKIYDGYTNNVISLGKGNKDITGKIEQIGKSTNSNYYVISNCCVEDKKLGTCRCYFSDEINPNAKIGNLVKVSAGTATIDDPMNEGEFNQKNYYRGSGISFISFAKEFEITNASYDRLRQGIYDVKLLIKAQVQKLFNEKDAGLFAAMITGDKSSIDKIQKKMFSDNGIAHILAISGLHLSILGLALFELLRKRFSIHFSAAVVSIFILLYGIFIDAGATSLRAICMLYVRFFSLAIGRTYDSKNTLYIICFIFLMLHPYLLFNAGFQFSYVAIFALNEEFVVKRKNGKTFKVPPVITLTLFLFPITIFHYFTYPLYSIFLNLIVIPLMSFVLGFGLVGLLVSFIFLPAGQVLTYVVHLIFLLYDKLCDIISYLPYHILWLGKPNLYEILYFYVAIFLIIWALGEHEFLDSISAKIKNEKIKSGSGIIRIAICLILVFLSIGILSIRNRSDFRATFLSIGQGDGILVESQDKVLLIDGGSSSNTSNGQYLLTPHVKSRAIDHIDYAFVSHPDADHTNGLIYLMNEEEELEIKNLVLPVNALVDVEYNDLKTVAANNKIPVIFVKEGDEFSIKDGFNIKVLSPADGAKSSKKNTVNELSLTMKVEYKDKSILFTGDIGKTAMNRMLKDEYVIENLKSDILKVPHHGSKNSNVEEFYEKISPKIAVISYGKNNTYGHPHKETVRSLTDVGSKVLKTGESGQIDLYPITDKYKTFIKK